MISPEGQINRTKTLTQSVGVKCKEQEGEEDEERVEGEIGGEEEEEKEEIRGCHHTEKTLKKS